jgi:diguanylate cyclase (GGDEF)-like protein
MTFFQVLPTLLGFGVLAFASLVFLTSHMRYRRKVLNARVDLASTGVAVEDVEILAAEIKIPAPITRMCLCGAQSLLPYHAEFSGMLRRSDRVIPLRDGRLVALLQMEEEQLSSLCARICPRLNDLCGFPVTPHPLRDFSDLFLPASELPEIPPTPTMNAGPLPGQDHLLDPLTGVLHPARVPHAFRKLLATGRIRNRPLCILRIDVDGMNEINQHLGRPAGDAVLRGVAQRLMRHCRESDLIGRLGDDEFLICLYGLPDDILGAAQRMAAAVRAEAVPSGDASVNCTVCIGLAGAPAHGQSPGALFEAAGLALQAARSRGRGVCLPWDRSLRPPPLTPQQYKEENRPDTF